MNKILWNDDKIYDFNDMEFLGETFKRLSIKENDYRNFKFYYSKELDLFFEVIDRGYFNFGTYLESKGFHDEFIFRFRELQHYISIGAIINALFMFDKDKLAMGLYERFVKKG